MKEIPSHESKESTPEIEIVKAQPEDLEQIEDVIRQTQIATYVNEEFGVTLDDIEDQFKKYRVPEYLAQQRREISNPGENRRFFVAKDGDKIVGVCSVAAADDHYFLNVLYILPEYQKREIGTRMLDRVEEFCHGKEIQLMVVEYNDRAIDFYTQLGFIKTQDPPVLERMKSGSTMPRIKMVLKS